MSSRFLTNLCLLLLSGFLAGACFAFTPPAVAWLAFAIACAGTLLALSGVALSRRSGGQRALDVIAVLLGAWLIVAARCFDAGTVKWIALGDASALIALAVIGLVAHELAAARSAPEVIGHNGDRAQVFPVPSYAPRGPVRGTGA